MENFILGTGVTILFFGFIHLIENIKIGNKEDLTQEERKWLENRK